jgi:membrane protease YdiL (CAAX protease family)
MMPSLWRGLRATAVYIAFIAAATVYVFRATSGPEGVIETLQALLPFQLFAAAFCVFVAMRHFGMKAAGFGKIDWSGLAWLLPAWIILAVMFWDIAQVLTPSDLFALGIGGLALLIVTPFFIALAEELMFRGILLRGAMTGLPLGYAMFLSAALFGAMHVVNGITGQDAAGTSQQMAFALLVGFALAPIAIRTGNLWPLIIWHWLWNLAVFTSQIAGILHPLVLPVIAMQALLCVWLWADLVKQARRV